MTRNRVMHPGPQGGFSLIELIVVVAMIAVLIGLVTPLFAPLRARVAVNEAVNQFARDVERQRQESRRESSITELTEIGGDSYTLVDSSGVSSVRRLPGAVVFSIVDEAELEFVGPYGVVRPLNVATVYRFSSTRADGVTAEMAVVGVLGKAIVR